MYQITINNNLTFEVEGFSETFDVNLNRTILSIRGENSIVNNGLNSLASLIQSIASQSSTLIQVKENNEYIWESDLYTLENASLTMMKKEVPIENSNGIQIENYMIINISFIYEIKEGD